MATRTNPLYHSQTGGPSAANARTTFLLGTDYTLDRRYKVISGSTATFLQRIATVADSTTGQIATIRKYEKELADVAQAKKALKELKLMRLLEQENIVRIRSIQLPESRESMTELYIVLEYAADSYFPLHAFQHTLSRENLQVCMYQLLKAVGDCISHLSNFSLIRP